MQARYPGHCIACGEDIEVREEITYLESDGVWVHDDCVLVHPTKPIKVCDKCYMTSCDCEED